MRKALCVAVLLVLAWTSSVLAGEKAFRNLCWGDPVSALGPKAHRGPDLYGADSGLEFWVTEDCDLQLGPLSAQGIYFGFFQNRLALITIVAMPYQLPIVQRIVEEKYGSPFRQDTVNTFYQRGDTVCLVTATDTLVLMTLTSMTILAEQQAWTKGAPGYKDAY